MRHHSLPKQDDFINTDSKHWCKTTCFDDTIQYHRAVTCCLFQSIKPALASEESFYWWSLSFVQDLSFSQQCCWRDEFFESDAMSLGKCFPMFWRITVPPSLGSSTQRILRFLFLNVLQTSSFLHDSIPAHQHACFQSAGYSVNHLSQDHIWYTLSLSCSFHISSIFKDCSFGKSSKTKQPTTKGLTLFSFYPAHQLQFHIHTSGIPLKLCRITSSLTRREFN